MRSHVKLSALALSLCTAHAWLRSCNLAENRQCHIVVTNGRPKNWAGQEPLSTSGQDKASSGFNSEPPMWPPLPAQTPLSPCCKELLQRGFPQEGSEDDEKLPGVPVAQIGSEILEQAPLSLVHAVNLEYPGLRLCHLDPPVFVVDNFLTTGECDSLVALADDPVEAMHAGSPTFGAASGTRTSDSWFLRYRAVPTFLDKVANLLGSVDKTHFEEPQLVRYASGQQFKWHLDEVPPSMLDNGGQRLATTLVYLNDVDDVSESAGATAFRDLGLRVVPRKGMALLFFPAFAHAGLLGSAVAKANWAAANNAAAAVKDIVESVNSGATSAEGVKSDQPGAKSTTSRAKAPQKRDESTKKKSKKGKSAAAPEADVAIPVEAEQGDFRTLHCGSPTMLGTKWIAQMWTHARPYEPKVPPGNAH